MDDREKHRVEVLAALACALARNPLETGGSMMIEGPWALRALATAAAMMLADKASEISAADALAEGEALLCEALTQHGATRH